jgi:hypothetical protein
MGEARRRKDHRAKQDTVIDYNKIEKMLLDRGHKPDYLDSKPDILIVTHDPPKGLDTIDTPYTRETPAADWRERGERDPHGYYYDNKKRHEIMGGHLTDDELAYKCGMASGRDLESIATLNMAKERIRWLSRKLVRAEKRLRELEDK